jgi:two-component system, NarL family, sensor kinase
MAEPAQDQLIFLLTLGTIGVLLLTLFIIIFFFSYQRRIHLLQQQKQKREIEFHRQMVESQLESQEKERVRIASDLHDSLGSLLWGAKVNAAFIERTASLQGDTKESYQELLDMLDQSIGVVRRISWELTPEAFYQAGLSESLATLCDRVNGKGMRVVFRQDGCRFWQDDRAMHVFRIVQELVSNCIKHARATELAIDLAWTENNLVVLVKDDGVGFSLDEKRLGVGWWNIQQRARQLKAEITMGKTPLLHGSTITLTVPLMYG